MPLIDRIEYALNDAPDLPLLELCRAVRSTDVSMVATLQRMVTLRRARGKVEVIPHNPVLNSTGTPAGTNRNGTVIASSGGP